MQWVVMSGVFFHASFYTRNEKNRALKGVPGKSIRGASYGLPMTHNVRLSEDLLPFLRSATSL
jgi:hypothetical protein